MGRYFIYAIEGYTGGYYFCVKCIQLNCNFSKKGTNHEQASGCLLFFEFLENVTIKEPFGFRILKHLRIQIPSGFGLLNFCKDLVVQCKVLQLVLWFF